MPPLFQCLYRKAYCFGNNLIKSHLSLKHKRQIMKAMDVEKDGRKIPSTVYFCGSENCNSTFPEEKELIKHSKMQHNQIIMPSGEAEDKKEGARTLQELDANKETGEKYECLYCVISFIIEPLHEKTNIWFLTWSDTNKTVQPQNMSRCLKFRI